MHASCPADALMEVGGPRSLSRFWFDQNQRIGVFAGTDTARGNVGMHCWRGRERPTESVCYIKKPPIAQKGAQEPEFGNSVI